MAIKSTTSTELAELGRNRWTTRSARAVLAAQQRSGESLTAFARRHGLLPQRLYWWRKRLAEWGAAEDDRGQRLVTVVTPEVSTAPTVEAPSSAQVRLRCGEVQIEVADTTAVPASWLAALVRELGEER